MAIGIDEEAVLGVDRLVAGADIGVGDQVQDLVRAGAADDPVRVQAIGAADRGAKRRRRAVGVEGERAGGGTIGLDRRRARSERRLVRRELVEPGAARRGGAAGHIGGDIEDAGTRGRLSRDGGHEVASAAHGAPIERRGAGIEGDAAEDAADLDDVAGGGVDPVRRGEKSIAIRLAPGCRRCGHASPPAGRRHRG